MDVYSFPFPKEKGKESGTAPTGPGLGEQSFTVFLYLSFQLAIGTVCKLYGITLSVASKFHLISTQYC